MATLKCATVGLAAVVLLLVVSFVVLAPGLGLRRAAEPRTMRVARTPPVAGSGGLRAGGVQIDARDASAQASSTVVGIGPVPGGTDGGTLAQAGAWNGQGGGARVPPPNAVSGKVLFDTPAASAPSRENAAGVRGSSATVDGSAGTGDSAAGDGGGSHAGSSASGSGAGSGAGSGTGSGSGPGGSHIGSSESGSSESERGGGGLGSSGTSGGMAAAAWEDCPPRVSAEPAVNLVKLKRTDWVPPAPKPFKHGQCLSAKRSDPVCWCPRGERTLAVEAAMRKQPKKLFAVLVGFSPKYGMSFKGGVKALWKPSGDGVAEYLSYKVAQILGSCHVPPVVPVALSPGLPTLVDRGVFKYHHAKSKKTIMRAKLSTVSDGAGGEVSLGAAVYMQPKVTAPYRYFHKMQSAYGFGPKMMAKHSKNSVPSSWNFKQYPVWNDFMQGPITRAGFLQHMDNATAERGIQQRRDLYADVSDQLVLDTLVGNPDRNRNHHTVDGRCGPRVTIDLAGAFVFHPAREGKDKYRVGKVTTQVHNLIQPMCKYRRRTVTRLRLLAQRMPRAAALQGTAVEALDGNWTGPMKVERRKEWRTAGPTLCLLAAELAASLPSYVPVQGAPGRVSMISYAGHVLRDSSALDILCDRLDQLVGQINKCVRKHGEANVVGELDTAVPPCDSQCNFHPFTSVMTSNTAEADVLRQAATQAVSMAGRAEFASASTFPGVATQASPAATSASRSGSGFGVPGGDNATPTDTDTDTARAAAVRQ